MRILLNKKYSHLKPFLDNIDTYFSQGTTIYQGRNTIRTILYQGIEINIKKYCTPHFFQRIAYSFIRKPKGERAFIYPQLLLKAGINTPEPIAYIERTKYFLIDESFFISIQCPFSRQFYEFAEIRDFTQDQINIINDFVSMTCKMHLSNILHLDYSPGNILFDYQNEKTNFSIVDLNRMKFGKVSVRNGCKNFARLWGQPEMYQIMAKQYAKLRNADENICLHWMLEERKKFWTKFVSKHGKRFTLRWTSSN